MSERLTPETLDELERHLELWEEWGWGSEELDWVVGQLPALIAAARERDRVDRLFVGPLLDDITARDDETLAFWRTDYLHADEQLGRVEEFRKRAEAAEAERDAAREALRKYGRHQGRCRWGDAIVVGEEPQPCTCGLSAALGESGEEG